MKDRHPKQIGSQSGALNVHVERGRDNDPEEFAEEMEEIELIEPQQGSRNGRATSNRAPKRRPEVNLNSRARQRAVGPHDAGERKQSDRGQGISNREAGTEKKRQQKVVSIRPAGKRAS